MGFILISLALRNCVLRHLDVELHTTYKELFDNYYKERAAILALRPACKKFFKFAKMLYLGFDSAPKKGESTENAVLLKTNSQRLSKSSTIKNNKDIQCLLEIVEDACIVRDGECVGGESAFMQQTVREINSQPPVPAFDAKLFWKDIYNASETLRSQDPE